MHEFKRSLVKLNSSTNEIFLEERFSRQETKGVVSCKSIRVSAESKFPEQLRYIGERRKMYMYVREPREEEVVRTSSGNILFHPRNLAQEVFPGDSSVSS